MELTQKQQILGVRVAKLIKKLIREKREPTATEMKLLAKSCKPDVGDVRDASGVLMSEGVDVLLKSGAIPENALTEAVSTLSKDVGECANFGEFMSRAFEVLPLDPAVKIAAAALMED